jgi:hypothetical protein
LGLGLGALGWVGFFADGIGGIASVCLTWPNTFLKFGWLAKVQLKLASCFDVKPLEFAPPFEVVPLELGPCFEVEPLELGPCFEVEPLEYAPCFEVEPLELAPCLPF